MDFGAHLPLIDFGGTDHSLGGLKSFARAAESLGYQYLTANDHLVFGRPWLDGPTGLTAVLEESGDMKLATTVVVPELRGPVATAKILGAIDILSGGRLTVAVGPGSSPRDYALIGVPFEERWKRLDECIQTMRAVWDESSAGFEGAFHTTAGESLTPYPAQAGGPDIWIGSWGSKVGMRRVVRLGDGWLASAYNTDPTKFQVGLHALREALTEVGRDAESFPNGIATMWTYVTEDERKATQILEDVLAPMLRREVDELTALLPIGSAEHCASVVQAYADAGAERIFIWPIRDEIEQLELFRRGVIDVLK